MSKTTSTTIASIMSNFWKFCDKIDSNPNTNHNFHMLPFKTVIRKFKDHCIWEKNKKMWVNDISTKLPIDLVIEIHKIEFKRKFEKVMNELCDIANSGCAMHTLSYKITTIKRQYASMSLLWVINKHKHNLDVI